MFGYVTADKMELKVKEYYRYKAYYCGLCSVLKEKHGRLGQMTLTYDMTFLILLLTSLYEQKSKSEQHRCLGHPTKKHWMLMNEVTEYAADMNIVLAYHNFLDDWQDEHSIGGYAGTKAFKRKYQKIEKRYKRQCKKIEESLRELQLCEKRNEENLDVVSDCFGSLMEELFIWRQDEWEQELRTIGRYLGKFIYLMDAVDDVEKDKKNHSYNPFVTMSEQKDFLSQAGEILTMMMAECVKSFETLPCIDEYEILRNILYTGVWGKFNQIIKRKGEEK